MICNDKNDSKNDSEDDFGTLHIYGQEVWHDSVYIIGTENDLKKLRDMLDYAIKNPWIKDEFFVNDGEGYSVIVKRCSEEEMNKLIPPYSEVEGKSGVHPFEEYKK